MSYTTDEILKFFAEYIESELGIVYQKDNYYQLQNRLEEIAKFQNVESLEKVYEIAKVGFEPRIRQFLLDLATNNETSFFRDPRVFNNLKFYINRWASQFPNQELKIWSAACSSGQESLSVAMTIKELEESSQKKIPFTITCTDISDRILERAKSAEYTQFEIQRGLSTPFLLKYFSKNEKNLWQAQAVLRSHQRFQKLNLLEPFVYRNNFDIILCRNVLLYQNAERKSLIIQKLHEALKSDGVLVLGAGESLMGLSDQFKTKIENEVVFYEKALKRVAVSRAS